MSGALVLLAILSAALTSLLLILAYAFGVQLHPVWTFLAIFLFTIWVTRKIK
jgi:hypothetical protein